MQGRVRPSRRSIRLPDHGYDLEGEYFVTICTRKRRPLLDAPAVRAIVQDVWTSLPARFPLVQTDAFVVMPNHVHGVIVILPPGAGSALPNGIDNGAGAMNCAPTLGAIVRGLKSVVARKTHAAGFTDLGWQRNYHEQVIRTSQALETIRQYIADNPERWDSDRENPDAVADVREQAFWRRFGDRRRRSSKEGRGAK